MAKRTTEYSIDFLAEEARNFMMDFPPEKRCGSNTAVSSILDKFDIRPRRFYLPKVEARLARLLQSETELFSTPSLLP